MFCNYSKDLPPFKFGQESSMELSEKYLSGIYDEKGAVNASQLRNYYYSVYIIQVPCTSIELVLHKANFY